MLFESTFCEKERMAENSTFLFKQDILDIHVAHEYNY